MHLHDAGRGVSSWDQDATEHMRVPGTRHPSSHRQRSLVSVPILLPLFIHLSFHNGKSSQLPVKILLFMIGFFDSAGDWPGFTQTLLSRLDLGSRVRRIIIKTVRRPRGPYIWSKSYTRNHRNQDEVPSRSKATSACLNNLQIKRQHSIFTQSTKSTTRDIFAVLLRFLQYNLSSCLF